MLYKTPSPTQDLMALEVFSGAGYVAQAFRGALKSYTADNIPWNKFTADFESTKT